MNTCHINGYTRYLNGKFLEAIGTVIGNERLARKGHQQQIHGKSNMAIGEARQLIQHCLKRQAKSAMS